MRGLERDGEHGGAHDEQEQQEAAPDDEPPVFPGKGGRHDGLRGEELVEVDGVDGHGVDLQGQVVGGVFAPVDLDGEGRQVVERVTEGLDVEAGDEVLAADGHALAAVEPRSVGGQHVHYGHEGGHHLAGLVDGHLHERLGVAGNAEGDAGLLAEQYLHGVDAGLYGDLGAEGGAKFKVHGAEFFVEQSDKVERKVDCAEEENEG